VAVLLATGGAAATGQTTPTSTVMSTLESHYSVLSDDTAISETPLPADVTGRPSFQTLVQQLGLDVGATRMAQGPNGFEEWVVPGTSGYCYFYRGGPGGGFGACSEGSPTGLLGSVGGGSSGYTVEGLVPDTNSTVSLTTTDGSSVTAPVSADGAVVVSSPEPLSELQMTGDLGTTTTLNLAVDSRPSSQ
jgi:hypothetical protein